jgi:hypothetical protein
MTESAAATEQRERDPVISDKMKKFIEGMNTAFVASSDQSGHPHLAAGIGPQVPDSRHVAFSAWFCHRTLENLAVNPRLAVAVMNPATGAGYQLIGRVEKTQQTGVLGNGLEKGPGPQVQYELVIRVEEVMEFTHGVHADRPISERQESKG